MLKFNHKLTALTLIFIDRSIVLIQSFRSKQSIPAQIRVRIAIDVAGLKYQPIQFVTDRDSAATSTGATSWKYL
jgi:hypothetical protein